MFCLNQSAGEYRDPYQILCKIACFQFFGKYGLHLFPVENIFLFGNQELRVNEYAYRQEVGIPRALSTKHLPVLLKRWEFF